jgi:hypothetical protein
MTFNETVWPGPREPPSQEFIETSTPARAVDDAEGAKAHSKMIARKVIRRDSDLGNSMIGALQRGF